MSQLSPSRIVCAANLCKVTLLVVASARHHDTHMNNMIRFIRVSHPDAFKHDRTEQGFMDQHGNFLSRTEAWRIAEDNGQIRRKGVGGENTDGGTLYSEHLY